MIDQDPRPQRSRRTRFLGLLAAPGFSLVLGDRAMAGLTIELDPANVDVMAARPASSMCC